MKSEFPDLISGHNYCEKMILNLLPVQDPCIRISIIGNCSETCMKKIDAVTKTYSRKFGVQYTRLCT
jgi:hypothetical protein